MIGTAFATYIRNQTRTNSTTLPDADIVIYANIKKDVLASKITEANEDYFGIFMTRNLEAAKRNYAFEPTQLNHMKYLEAKLDGLEFKRLKEYDINSMGGTSSDETSILAYMADRAPGFDIFGNELLLLSDAAIIDVTSGLKLWTIIYPADITAGTLASADDLSIPPSSVTFGLPRQFHELWADAVIMHWKNSQPKPVPLTKGEIQFDDRLKEALGQIKNANLDRSIEANMPYDDGSNY